jgi:endonuclease YncB( thermonuclease family)
MKRIIFISFALFFFIFVNCVSAQTFTGKIVRVKDGDTVVAIDKDNTQYTIRLSCIDTPEKKQDFGTKSKEFLASMCFGQEVTIKIKNKDRYGRYIGTLYKEDLNINLQMVKAGYAWVYRAYCNDLRYYKAEKKAKKYKLGLWLQGKPIPPWEFRKIKSKKTSSLKEEKKIKVNLPTVVFDKKLIYL